MCKRQESASFLWGQRGGKQSWSNAAAAVMVLHTALDHLRSMMHHLDRPGAAAPRQSRSLAPKKRKAGASSASPEPQAPAQAAAGMVVAMKNDEGPQGEALCAPALCFFPGTGFCSASALLRLGGPGARIMVHS